MLTISYPVQVRLRDALTGRKIRPGGVDVPIPLVKVYLDDGHQLSYVAGTEGSGFAVVAPYDLVSCTRTVPGARRSSTARPSSRFCPLTDPDSVRTAAVTLTTNDRDVWTACSSTIDGVTSPTEKWPISLTSQVTG